MKTVNDLVPGEKGCIEAINARPEIKRRLMDMGIIEGAVVEMIRPAPLGDPLEIKVHNTLLALRRCEAEVLILQPLGDEHGQRRYRHRFGRQS